MKLFGLEITRATKAALPAKNPARDWQSSGSWHDVRSVLGGWFNPNGVDVDPKERILAFSAVYSCVTLIAADISKLQCSLLYRDFDKTWHPVTGDTLRERQRVLNKPNRYSTSLQFFETWILSKLIHGNAFILLQRNLRGVVESMYLLDPQRVQVLVSPDGSVFYQLSEDNLTGLREAQITVPASEIIHDRAACLFHPLVGVGPIYACGVSSTQGNRIQANSATFFHNMSRPSGMLTAPESITDEVANRLKTDFEANFSGANLGRLLVLGDGLTYSPMAIPAQQAQLIEQLRWTAEDVARCFHVPLHKIASDSGVKFNNMAQMNQEYFDQCLHSLIESMEGLLTEALLAAGLPDNIDPDRVRAEFDLEGLLRMDPLARAQRNEIGIRAGYLSPNEARLSENLAPVAGGYEPYLQQQNFPLSVLVQQPPPGKVGDVAAKVAPVLASMQKTVNALTRAGQLQQRREVATND